MYIFTVRAGTGDGGGRHYTVDRYRRGRCKGVVAKRERTLSSECVRVWVGTVSYIHSAFLPFDRVHISSPWTLMSIGTFIRRWKGSPPFLRARTPDVFILNAAAVFINFAVVDVTAFIYFFFVFRPAAGGGSRASVTGKMSCCTRSEEWIDGSGVRGARWYYIRFFFFVFFIKKIVRPVARRLGMASYFS